MRSFPDLWSLEEAIHKGQLSGEDVSSLQRIAARSRAYSNGWGTHLPLLASVVAVARPGSVIEFGSGHFSTPVLHEMCKAMNRRFVSLESDRCWAEAHKDILQCEVALHWPVARYEAMREGWSVAFIDNQPDEERLPNIEAMADRAEFIVVHDTCNPYFAGVDKRLDQFAFRYDYTHMTSCTTVVSNVREYPGAIK